MEETSTLHIKDDQDYQGRSFLHIPQGNNKYIYHG
jgi:hypothetical protein